MEQRLTICNMTIEGGGRAGMIAPDETTIEYVRGRPGAPEDFEDAAEAFVACAERAPEGAHVFNVHGESAAVSTFLEHARAALGSAAERIRVEGPPIPIAEAMDGGALQRAIPGFTAIGLREGVQRTVAGFTALQRGGRLGEVDLPS